MTYTVVSPFEFGPAGVLPVGMPLTLSDDLAAPLLEMGFIEPVAPAPADQ